jgi:hypothetical protein
MPKKNVTQFKHEWERPMWTDHPGNYRTHCKKCGKSLTSNDKVALENKMTSQRWGCDK